MGDSTVLGQVKPSPRAPAFHLGVVSWPDPLLTSPENSEEEAPHHVGDLELVPDSKIWTGSCVAIAAIWGMD